jgi:hypothetical protein
MSSVKCIRYLFIFNAALLACSHSVGSLSVSVVSVLEELLPGDVVQVNSRLAVDTGNARAPRLLEAIVGTSLYISWMVVRALRSNVSSDTSSSRAHTNWSSTVVIRAVRRLSVGAHLQTVIVSSSIRTIARSNQSSCFIRSSNGILGAIPSPAASFASLIIVIERSDVD